MSNPKIGILAGEGNMPVYIARNARARGYDVYVLGLKGNARLADYKGLAADTGQIRLGQLGAGIAFFRDRGVSEVVMAGRVQHTSIFTNLMPDKRGLAFLTSLKSMQTKQILSRLIEECAKDGVHFVNSALFLEDFFLNNPSDSFCMKESGDPV